MCRIGAIKSKRYVYPSTALRMMLPQQEGHDDNSGFAMVMQDLGGVFSLYKDKPLLSMACTKKGARLVEDYMSAQNFVKMAEWLPVPNKRKGLDIQTMPYYIFRNYDYPEHYDDTESREALLLDTRLELRKILTESNQGYVYSFWPDVLTLKEILATRATLRLTSGFGTTTELCSRKILSSSVGRTRTIKLSDTPRIRFSCKATRFAPTVKILSTRRTRSSRRLCIVGISALNRTRKIFCTRCITSCTS